MNKIKEDVSGVEVANVIAKKVQYKYDEKEKVALAKDLILQNEKNGYVNNLSLGYLLGQYDQSIEMYGEKETGTFTEYFEKCEDEEAFLEIIIKVAETL